MASRAESRVVNLAGLVQGITSVTFPAASSIFTDPTEYDISDLARRHVHPNSGYPERHPLAWCRKFGLAGLGCSALLPLTISLGQNSLTTMSAAVAG
jgi:hypothetical protein